MKLNRFFLIILFVFALILCQSCNKDNAIIKTNSDATMANPDLKDTPGGGYCDETQMQTLYDIWWPNENGWHIVYCCWPRDNCLPEAVITSVTSRTKTAYEDFILHFENDSVDKFFVNGDYEILFPKLDSLPSSVLADLKDKDILLYHSYSIADSIDYYIGLPTSVSYSTNNFKWVGSEECVLRIDKQY